MRFDLSGELGTVDESESMSDVSDLVEDDGVIRILRFFPDDDRDSLSDPGGFLERSDRLLGCLSIDARLARSSSATGKKAPFADASGASCTDDDDGRRCGVLMLRRRRASSDHSWNVCACCFARSASEVGRFNASSTESMSESSRSNATGVAASLK